MSSRELYDHRTLLERDPALLAEVERLVEPGIDERLDFSTPREMLGASQTVQDDWPEPEPLGGELPPVQACDIVLLPESLRPLIEDTAERMQVPLDYPAVVAVLASRASQTDARRYSPRRPIPRGSWCPIYGVALSPRQV